MDVHNIEFINNEDYIVGLDDSKGFFFDYTTLYLVISVMKL